MATKAYHKGQILRCRYVRNIMNEIFLITCEECDLFRDSWWKIFKLKSLRRTQSSHIYMRTCLTLNCYHRCFQPDVLVSAGLASKDFETNINFAT